MGRPANNLENQRFGKLIVIERDYNTKPNYKSSMWLCKCDCGDSTVVESGKLKKGHTQSCGCARSKLIDLVGKKFGKLTVISFNKYKDNDKHQALWNCSCECGNTCIRWGSGLRTSKSNINSCGCYKNRNNITNKESKLYYRYSKAAKDNNREFTLSIERFLEEIQKDCHYCGISPVRSAENTKGNHLFYYNGIDRKDNDKGYIEENILPCCTECNFAKGFKSYEEFIDWLDRISKFRDKIKNKI